MIITIEHDDGTTEIFKEVTDFYIAYRALKSVASTDGLLYPIPEVRSFSWGGRLREITKEITQSLIELQDKLREFRNGGSS